MLAITLFSKLPLVFTIMSGFTLLLAANLFLILIIWLNFFTFYPTFWDTGTIPLPGMQTWNAVAVQSLKSEMIKRGFFFIFLDQCTTFKGIMFHIQRMPRTRGSLEHLKGLPATT